jgi:hypothetical protein
MSLPTISRTKPGHLHWRPHLYPDGYYRLASPDVPYDEAKKESSVVLTASLEVAGRLVERGFRLRMSDGAGGEPSMIKPENLKLAW